MIDSEILQKLARSGELATRTHNRALTRSLLGKALNCSLVYEVPQRSHTTDSRDWRSRGKHSRHHSYKQRDFTSNSLSHDNRRDDDDTPKNWVYYRSNDSQQEGEMRALKRFINQNHRDHVVKGNDARHSMRKNSDQASTDSLTLSSNKGQKHSGTDSHPITIKKSYAVDDDHVYMKKKNSTNDDTIFIKRKMTGDVDTVVTKRSNTADDDRVFMKKKYTAAAETAVTKRSNTADDDRVFMKKKYTAAAETAVTKRSNTADDDRVSMKKKYTETAVTKRSNPADDDRVCMKKTYTDTAVTKRSNTADDDHIFMKRKSSANVDSSFMKKTNGEVDEIDSEKDFHRTEDGHKRVAVGKCYHCAQEVDSLGQYAHDEHQLWTHGADSSQQTHKCECLQHSRKDHFHLREIDVDQCEGSSDGGEENNRPGPEQYGYCSDDEGEENNRPGPEQYGYCSDDEGEDKVPDDNNIDVTMRNLSEMMNNISHLCECYYDSCQKDNLSHTERRHLRTFHKGVLPAKMYTQHTKAMENPKKGKETSSYSSSLDSEVRCHGVRFLNVGPSLDAKLDYANTNSHYTETSDRYPSTQNGFSSHGRTLRSSRTSNVCKDNISPTGWTDSESETDILMHSNKNPPAGTLCPISTSSPTCVSFEPKLKRIFAKTEKKNDITGVNLSKNIFIEGVSAFPTHNISFQPKSSKVKPKSTKNNYGQGIYLTTKPGTYVLRKPQKKSSIHLLHVNPGNYVKFNM